MLFSVVFFIPLMLMGLISSSLTKKFEKTLLLNVSKKSPTVSIKNAYNLLIIIANHLKATKTFFI